MELIYLWIEEYKNIKNQGFNFSPRFHCKYKDNELIIEENKDYVHIFPENINITAIVGKNGSGKSSILDIILQKTDYKLDCEYIFISYCSRLKIITNNNINENNIKCDLEYLLDNNKSKLLSFCIENIVSFNHKYNPIMSQTTLENPMQVNAYETMKGIQVFSFNKNNFYTYFIKSIFNILKNKDTIKTNFKKNIFEPKEIFLEFFVKEEYLESQNKNIKSLQKYLQKLKSKPSNEILKDILLKLFDYKKTKEEIIPYNWDKKILINNIKEMSNYFKIKIEKLDDEIIYFNDTMILPKIILKLELKNQEIEHTQISNFLEILQIFNIKFDVKGIVNNQLILLSSLSQGEQDLIMTIAILNNYIEEKNLVLFDESYNSLHPEWQKRLLYFLIEIYKHHKDKKFHVVFTTHSPFLISDLPKENIIFLDTYKKNDKKVKNKEQKVGNCKVLTQNEVLDKKQTFGANIHTLLSDSFFMQDGLMGEFAKSKINEILDCYKKVEEKSKNNNSDNLEDLKSSYEKKKEEFWEIQRIIGEPYLQTIIKNYLDELEILFSGKNSLIEKELKKLEKRKRYLEDLRNDKN